MFVRISLTPSVSAPPSQLHLTLGGETFYYRASRDQQHEFTPEEGNDLSHWNERATWTLYPELTSDSHVNHLAAKIARYYHERGKVIQKMITESGEHHIIAQTHGDEIHEAVTCQRWWSCNVGLVKSPPTLSCQLSANCLAKPSITPRAVAVGQCG